MKAKKAMQTFGLEQWFLTFSLPRLPSTCPLFQAPLATNKLQKQMYCLLNLLIKHSMLYSAEGLAPPWKCIIGERAPPFKNHWFRAGARKYFLARS